MKRRFLRTFATATLGAAVLAAPVAAGASVSTYEFYGCTGGDLSSFTAVKTLLPAAEGGTASSASAFRLVDSTRIYVVYDFGFGHPHGIDASGVATVWCWVTYSSVGTVQVGGQLSAA
jgi:hypothetical protein